MAGAPIGNTNAANAKVAKAALERALDIRSPTERYQTLVHIWDKQIDKALEGDLSAAVLIIERLDGKPAQSIDTTVDVVGNLASLIELARKRVTEHATS